jgi:hypothetical protein
MGYEEGDCVMKLGVAFLGLLLLSAPTWAYMNSSSPESVCISNLSDVQDVHFAEQLQDVAVCKIGGLVSGGGMAVLIGAGIVGVSLIVMVVIGIAVLGLIRRG